ncbi:thiamine pyrophosphokinase [Spiromyces aspiralis]|uniref:Thiamine pyrophosphokinase n=1 Tax=Spiromyces aspiralis TaxID=68401 RepID=A0ACC1HCR5_9FUNG|nr:thiamine pyrophosphokinase [Spiromyces aspiralis]
MPAEIRDQLLAATKVVLLILNQPIPDSQSTLFDSLWQRGKYLQYAGHCIPAPRDLSAQNVPALTHLDDNTTDFMKALSYIDDRVVGDNMVIVFGDFGGRLDHAMHTLHVLNNEGKRRKIMMITPQNIVFAIRKGTTKILFDKDVDGPACGLLPLAGPVRLTTCGLRWNLDDHESSFEGMMSTSNIIDGPEVIVSTTNTIIWTGEFRATK